jgi:hypothetical protein
MRQSNQATCWVVYERPATAKMSTMKVVCEQSEWDQLTKDNPELTLVRSGITNEGEAEQLARDGTAGLRDAPKRFR